MENNQPLDRSQNLVFQQFEKQREQVQEKAENDRKEQEAKAERNREVLNAATEAIKLANNIIEVLRDGTSNKGGKG